MQAVILAGGEGTRLHSVNTSIPKPLAPLFDRPVLEHTITLLARHGITDIILTVAAPATELIGYFGNGSAFGAKIRYSVEADPLGTAGAVKLVQGMLKETFVVVSGDVVTDADLTAALTHHRAASAVATLLLHEADDPTQFGVVDCDSAGKITRILEKPKSADAFSNVVNTGIYILEPEVLGSVPHYQPCDFTREVFPRMLANQEPVYGFAVEGYWCDIGNLRHYRRVHFDALEGKLSLDLPAAHIGRGIWMGEHLEVDNSAELVPPVYLGSGSVLRHNAKIGPNTVIGENSLIDEDARISNSVIGGQSYVGKNAEIKGCIVAGGYSVGEDEQVSDKILVEHVEYQPTPLKPISAPTWPAAEAAELARRRSATHVTGNSGLV